MAVSHQWFIQWSAPSMILADITNKYNNVNNWNNLERKLSQSNILRSGENNNYLTSDSNNGRLGVSNKVSTDKLRYNDRANKARAGLTLWLAMLGVAQPQSIPADTETPPFNTLYKWKTVDFEFPSPRLRNFAINTGKFVPENVLPLGVEVYGSRVWVTFPNWREGVPATLATLPRSGGQSSPPVKPYPDWSYHTAFRSKTNNCSGMTSVFRVNVDSCGKLWVLDSGQINLQNNPIQICPPSIFVFDLNTDTLVARYIIPKRYILQDSLYSNIIIDSRNEDCSDLHAYIADTWRFGLLVFRQSDEQFWRFSNPLFFPDPLAANLTLHGLNFQWTDGLFGLSLTPVDYIFDERILFFNSLASYREFFVSTSVLRDPAKVNSSGTDFYVLGESRGINSQVSASAMDRRGVMFYGLVMKDSIGCWDSKKLYRKRSQGLIAHNRETLVFPNDIKVDQEPEQSLWILSNRLPMFQASLLDPDDYNYRIMYVNTEEAVKGTVCDPEIKLPPASTLIHRGWLP